jgi:hypothetical protein
MVDRTGFEALRVLLWSSFAFKFHVFAMLNCRPFTHSLEGDSAAAGGGGTFH